MSYYDDFRVRREPFCPNIGGAIPNLREKELHGPVPEVEILR